MSFARVLLGSRHKRFTTKKNIDKPMAGTYLSFRVSLLLQVALSGRRESRNFLIDQPAQENWLEITPDERTMATLAHALQLIGSWIAPLIIFLVRRRSRFVSFHALQALLLQIVHTILVVVLMVFWFSTIFSVVFHQTSGKAPDFPPVFFILFPLVWLGFMGLWVGTLVIAILYAIKAGRGEWADYPVLGKLARKMLKMGPNETHLAPTPQM
jgi:uncharacterized membrane protein